MLLLFQLATLEQRDWEPINCLPAAHVFHQFPIPVNYQGHSWCEFLLEIFCNFLSPFDSFYFSVN